MKEADYILATDLRTVRIMKDALRDIVSENNPSVPEAEYAEVLKLLTRWEVKMFARVNAE